MKIAGIILIALGLLDLLGSYADFDLWGGLLGIQLPDLLWQYSAYLELLAGYLLFKADAKSANTETEEGSA